MRDNNNINSVNVFCFDVSIIIPVEYHRGQAIECIRGWAQEQDYPANQYQIILCAPNTLETEMEVDIRALLRPWDRLEKCAFNHDMSLVAAAAHSAESKILLFTESHCIPKNNAISSMLATVTEHPEWSGFSCQTSPITHNLLSEIESDIYVKHIRQALESTGWQKVVDQCFLVRRDAYFEAGGFRPSFGHFAEWLLAAEMHRLGKVIGIYSPIVISHYYTGDLQDLQGFTLDFARGQIKYLAEHQTEPTITYFPEIPELQEYCQRSNKDYRAVAWAKTIALLTTLIYFLRSIKNGQSHASMLVVLGDWFESVLKAFSLKSLKIWISYKVFLQKKRLKLALHNKDKSLAKIEFIAWFAKLASLARLQYLLDNPLLLGSAVRNRNFPVSGELNFQITAQNNSSTEWLGAFDSEENAEGESFFWSKPTTSVWLPLYEGHYRITIEWDKVRPLPSFELFNVNFNGISVAKNAISLNTTTLVIEVISEAKSWHQLIWSVAPLSAAMDKRLLGLPIKSIHWCLPNMLPDRDGALNYVT
ncbi:MAG TPA: hypothetical protein VK946_04955 [Methylotenera sp.]|nr:hypothetical protein [Methylotenera sp.]